jgi:hypothetical protein
MARTDAPPPPADAAPRFTLGWAALVSAAATLLLAWPALGGKFLVNPHSDQYIAGYPFREFAAESLRQGNGFPLWNPYQFGGMPFVAAMHGDIFYPTFLLRMVLPTDVAMTWGFIVHMVLAGLFTVGFLRACGVRFQPALVGGVAYLMSGAVASYASPGHDGKLFVSTLLPAALWALVRGVRDGRMAAWGALAILVGLAVLSPHPQLLQYLLLASGAFALYVALRPDAVPHQAAAATDAATAAAGPRAGLPRLALALGAVVLGGAMGAVQYLPVREYVPWSPRAGGKGYDYATSFSFPLEETLNAYLPQFSGILDHYWGRNGIHFHSDYAGVAVLVLACLAVGGGVLNRHRRHAWFWVGALIVSLFWAWGGNTPFYQIVYALVPGSKFFRAPSTILYVTAFSLAVLAAFGTERALTGRVSTRFLVGWGTIAVAVALVATAGGFTNLAMALLGDVTGDRIEANAPNVVIGAWRSAGFAFATCGLLWMLARGRLAANIAGWLCIGLVAIDLWSIERHYWMFSEPASVIYAEDDIIRYMKSQPQPVRVLALPLSNNMAPNDAFLRGAALMHHKVRGVLGYHGNELGRYQQLYGKDEGFQPIANPNFWALTNTQFFYTNAAETPFQGAELVAGPVRNAAGTMTWLFRLPGDHPVGWVAPLIVKLDDEATRATIMNPLFDVRRVAVFDSAAAVTAQPVNSPIPDRIGITVTASRFDPGAIDLSLDAPAPAGSALVVSENYYPGWTATVDGQAAAIGRANLTLIGVELPAGARQVSLRFDSAPYRTGLRVTQAALAIALLLVVAGVGLDRRRQRTAPGHQAAA